MTWQAPDISDLNRRAVMRTPRRKQWLYSAAIFGAAIAYGVVRSAF